MDQDQPRANTSATIDPDTIAGTQTHPNTSDSSVLSNSTDSILPNNDPLDPPVTTTNDNSPSSSPPVISSDPTNDPPISSTPSYTPIIPSSDSLDSPSMVVSSDSSSRVSPKQYSDIKPGGSTNAIVTQSKPTNKERTFKFNKTAVLATVAALTVIVVAGIGSLILTSSGGNNANATGSNKPISTDYKPQSLALGNITGYNQLLTGKNQSLQVNGKLSVADSIVLSPSTTPSNPTLGQLYYNATNNTPYYYNGKQFVSLIPSVGGTGTIAGTTSSISLGTGLGLQGSSLVSTGVTSLTGTPNQIIASASRGSVKLSLPTNLSIAGAFSAGTITTSSIDTTNSLVANNLNANSITTNSISGNGFGITDINPNALPSTLAYQDRNNTFTGSDTFANSTNSTNAFSIQDAAGNTLLNADTTTDSLTVNNLLPETPGSVLAGVTTNAIINNVSPDAMSNDVIGPDGFVQFAYSVNNPNTGNDDLHLVHCTNATCTTYTDQVVVAGSIVNGNNTYMGYISIALDGNGYAKIAYSYQYYDTNVNNWDFDVDYVGCTNADCSTNSQTPIAQSNGDLQYQGTSITIGSNGFPQIVYGDFSNNQDVPTGLFLASCTDNTCASVNTTTLVTGDENDALYPANVVLGSDGFLRVLYFDGEQGLSFIQCTNANCTSPVNTTIDSDVNWEDIPGNLAIGSNGLPVLLYTDGNNGLTYAQCTDASCSTSNTTILDPNTNSFTWYGLAIVPDGYARISYTNGSGYPEYIDCSNAACSGATPMTVDSSDNENYGGNSLVLGSDGLARIVYNNYNTNTINFALFGTANGQKQVSGTNIGSSSDTFGTIYAQSIQTSGLTSNNGELIVQSTPNSANAFTVQDAAGNNLLNVNSLTDTTTLSTVAPTSLGPNLITDTDFTNNSDWTGTNWTMTPTTATYTGSGGDPLGTNQFGATYQDTYQVSFTVSNDTNNGCIQAFITSSGGNNYCQDGTYTDNITAGGSLDPDALDFYPDSTPFNGTISNVSVEQVITNDVLVVDAYDGEGPALTVDSSGYLTLNDLSNNDGSTALCLNNSNQVANCSGSSGSSINNGTSTQDNANFNIQSASSSDVGGIIQGASGQTAALLELEDSGGDPLDVFDSSGDLGVGGSLAVGNGLNVLNTNSGVTGELIQGAPSQSADLLDLSNSSGEVLDSFNANGDLQLSSNSNDSTTAFQIQDSSANTVLDVDTTDHSLIVTGGPITVSPTQLGSNITTDSSPNYIAVSGNYAYVVNYGSNTLQIFNISNPASVSQVGSNVTTDANPISVAVSGNYAYVVNWGSNTLQIFNISNPASVSQVGSDITTGTNPFSVAVSGNYVYVVNLSSETLQIFNISNPASVPPALSTTATGTYPQSVAVSGNYAYVANYGSDTLQIFNISNPASVPPALSTTATGTSPDFVTVSGNYAYVVNWGSGTLQIFNISNPASVSQVGSDITTGTNPQSVAISGNYAYVVNWGSGTLQIFNISNPASVSQVGSNVTTGGGSTSIAISGNYAYVVNSSGSLQVFSLNSTPTLNVENASGSSVLSVDATGASNILTINNPNNTSATGVLSLSNTGALTLQNTTNSTNAFEVQDSSSNPILSVDSVNDSVGIGTSTPGANLDIQSDGTATGLNVNTTGSGNLLQLQTGGVDVATVSSTGATTFQNSTDSSDAFQIQDASGNPVFWVDTTTGAVHQPLLYADVIEAGAGLTLTSTGGFDFNDGVDPPSLFIDSNGATLFQNSTNSAIGFQVQDASGVTLLDVNTSSRDITVSGDTTTFAELTLSNSHFQSTQTTPPTISIPTNCGGGTGPTATVTAGSTDSAGSFTITAGSTGSPTTCVTTLTFNKAYGSAPKSILFSPTTATGGSKFIYLSASSAATFTTSYGTGETNPANSEADTFNYWVIE